MSYSQPLEYDIREVRCEGTNEKQDDIAYAETRGYCSKPISALNA